LLLNDNRDITRFDSEGDVAHACPGRCRLPALLKTFAPSWTARRTEKDRSRKNTYVRSVANNLNGLWSLKITLWSCAVTLTTPATPDHLSCNDGLQGRPRYAPHERLYSSHMCCWAFDSAAKSRRHLKQRRECFGLRPPTGRKLVKKWLTKPRGTFALITNKANSCKTKRHGARQEKPTPKKKTTYRQNEHTCALRHPWFTQIPTPETGSDEYIKLKSRVYLSKIRMPLVRNRLTWANLDDAATLFHHPKSKKRHQPPKVAFKWKKATLAAASRLHTSALYSKKNTHSKHSRTKSYSRRMARRRKSHY